MFIRGRPITMYIPSNVLNYEDLKMELPSEKLELDWVYPRCVVLPSGGFVPRLAVGFGRTKAL